MYNLDSQKRLPGLLDISYVDKFKSCNIELFELRRIQSDLIVLSKILNGLIYVNIDNYLTLSMSNNWGNVCKLFTYYSSLDVTKYFLRFEYLIFGIHCLII